MPVTKPSSAGNAGGDGDADAQWEGDQEDDEGGHEVLLQMRELPCVRATGVLGGSYSCSSPVSQGPENVSVRPVFAYGANVELVIPSVQRQGAVDQTLVHGW